MNRRLVLSWGRRAMASMSVLSVLLLSAQTTHAGVRYHVATNGVDTANGLSWATALATISNAMTRVGEGDTVMLSNGTFAITAQINLTNAVTFTSTNGWAYTTVDAGNIAGRRVFYMTNEGAVIDGLTIMRGNGDGSSVNPKNNGGGVWMAAGRVQNCLLTNNIGFTHGGNVYMTGGTVSNCTLTKGSASYDQGGGVYISGSGAVVQNCTIRNNSSVREGGGIGIGAGGGTVRNCTITANFAASRENGAIYMVTGLVENCLIASNTAANYYNRGTVSLDGGGEVRYCTVVDNQSGGSSAGIWASGANAVVRNCIVYNTPSTGAWSRMWFTRVRKSPIPVRPT